MARDLDDRNTKEMELDSAPQPKKRGRPRTGKAMTNAERQKKFRAERAEKFVTVTIKKEDMEQLLTLIQNPDPFIKDKIIDTETLERLKECFGMAKIIQIDKRSS